MPARRFCNWRFVGLGLPRDRRRYLGAMRGFDGLRSCCQKGFGSVLLEVSSRFARVREEIRHDAAYRAEKLLLAHRFGYVAIHPAPRAFVADTFEHVRAEGDDGRVADAAELLEFPDFGRGLEAA